MAEMTGRERISRILKRQPVDRIGAAESFWKETGPKWTAQGHLPAGQEPEDHFGLDIRFGGGFNYIADPDFKDQIVEEDQQTKLVRNGNGALLRWWKDKSGTPEHVDFAVKDRTGWEERIRPLLIDPNLYRKRMDFQGYGQFRQQCRQKEVFLCWIGRNVFECIHPVCGHEYMLMGMALDPDWVKDMCDVFAELIINLLEMLFAEQGRPDGVFLWEDMGFKHKPFMSPAMYKQMVWPAHKRIFDFIHSLGLQVIIHSCGFVEPLVPALIEAGMDGLQAMEVKAGMDLLRIKKAYGDKIVLMGGMDVRHLVANDRAAIEAELQKKLPLAMHNGGYILHSDHSIPDQVEYETYKFFLERGRELGTYR